MDKFDLWPSLKLYEKLGVPYVLHSNDWSGPLWTGHCMMLSTRDSYGDAGFFHELAHWLATSEEDRKHPDFRLGRQVNAQYDYTFATSSVATWADPDHNSPPHSSRGKNRGWGEDVMDLGDASENEFLACAALALYEPLCGVWSWRSKIDIQKINDALYDFNANDLSEHIGEYPVEHLHDMIVQPLDLSVKLSTVRSYIGRLMKADKAYWKKVL